MWTVRGKNGPDHFGLRVKYALSPWGFQRPFQRPSLTRADTCSPRSTSLDFATILSDRFFAQVKAHITATRGDQGHSFRGQSIFVILSDRSFAQASARCKHNPRRLGPLCLLEVHVCSMDCDAPTPAN